VDDGPATPATVTGTDLTAAIPFPQDGDHTVTLNVIDSTGRVGFTTTTAHILNAAPLASLTGPAIRTVQAGSSVNLSGTFTDLGAADDHTGVFTLTSGETVKKVNATVTESAGRGTAQATTTLGEAGNWLVSFQVFDDKAASEPASTVDGQPMTIFVTGIPPASPRQIVLADFDTTVAQYKVAPSVAAPLRTLLDQAATLAASGKKTDRASALLRLAAYTAATITDTLFRKVSITQAGALLKVASRAASTLKLGG
jgi:hypothetical protein